MNWIKKHQFYFYSFFIPFFLILFVFFLNGNHIYDYFISDNREQYFYLFPYLKKILTGSESLFYSFGRGLGGSMYATFFYYLASPFNLLVLIGKEASLWLPFLSLLKISLSGLTMYYYLDHTYKKEKAINLLFALSYAFMSYNIIYNFHMMWLDPVYLTPLIAYGFDKIIHGESSTLYIFTFSFCIITNFYISYMVAIFLGLYFLYRMVTREDRKGTFKITLRFLFSSLCAVLISAFVLLPVFQELRNSYRDNSFMHYIKEQNLFDILMEIASIKCDTKNAYIVPHFATTMLITSTLFSYFLFQRDQNKKWDLLFVTIFLLSFMFPSIVKIWHGFDTPAFFFHRWSFLLSFFLILLARKHFSLAQEIARKEIFFSSILYSFLLILGLHFGSYHEFPTFFFISNLYFFFSYLMFHIIKIPKKTFFLILLFLLEIFTITKISLITNRNYKEPGNNNDLIKNVELVKELDDLDSSFYRIGGNGIYSPNELQNMENASFQYFLSCNEKNNFLFLLKSGYKVAANEVHANLSMWPMNAILGMKYMYSKKELSSLFKIKEFSWNERDIFVYEDPYALPIGFQIENKKVEIDDTNLFTYQNSFFKFLFGKSLYYPLEVEATSDGILVQNKGKDIYFKRKVECTNEEYKRKKENGEESEYCYDVQRINSEEMGTTLKIIDDITLIDFYSLDDETEEILKNYLSKSITSVDIKKNKMIFKIDAKEDGMLFLSVPYNENFQFYVDGIKVKKEALFEETFLGVFLLKGEHQVEVIYELEVLKPAIFISILGLFLTFFYLKVGKRDRKKCNC